MKLLRVSSIFIATMIAVNVVPAVGAFAESTACGKLSQDRFRCGGSILVEGTSRMDTMRGVGERARNRSSVGRDQSRRSEGLSEKELTVIPAKSWIAICPDPQDPTLEVECSTLPPELAQPVRVAARPAGQAVPPRPLSIEEFKDFPVAKGELLIQPDQGRHTVNMPVVVATTARQHVVSGDLLGFAFHVRFTPVSHAFDYGDGSAPYVTGDPNTPYPNQRFWHEWWTIGDKTISVTTTWSGAYQVAGSAWVEVPGTLETTVSSEPQRVDEYHILLTDPDKATGGKHHDSDYDWLKGTPLDPNNQP